jgi:hypothetical protein
MYVQMLMTFVQQKSGMNRQPCCRKAGWPDEFFEEMAQNVAQPHFFPKLMLNFFPGVQSRPNIWAISVCNFGKTAQSV